MMLKRARTQSLSILPNQTVSKKTSSQQAEVSSSPAGHEKQANKTAKVGNKLSLELIPTTAACKSLKDELSASQYQFMHNLATKRAGGCCEICGAKETAATPLLVYEQWRFNIENMWPIQRLDKLMSICGDCHACKHIDQTLTKNQKSAIIEHLCKVNQITPSEANELINTALQQKLAHSCHLWTLDIQKIRDWLLARAVS